MKKWILFLSLISLMIIVVACGANDEAVSGNVNQSTNEDSIEAGAGTSSELMILASNYKFDKEEYRIKAGETIDMTLKSVGGVHGIKINKTDYNISGKGTIPIKIDEPGTYDIVCSIACGSGHGLMRAKLIVE